MKKRREDPIRTLHKAGWSAEDISRRLMRNLNEIQALLAASEDTAQARRSDNPREDPNASGRSAPRAQSKLIPYLGSASDGALGLRFRLSAEDVAALRNQNGIAPIHAPTRDKAARWTKSMLRLLGKATDRELARRFGLHSGTVGKMRRSLNIPAYCRRPARSNF